MTSVWFSSQYLMRMKCQNLQFIFVGKKREKWLVIRRLAGDLAGWLAGFKTRYITSKDRRGSV